MYAVRRFRNKSILKCKSLGKLHLGNGPRISHIARAPCCTVRPKKFHDGPYTNNADSHLFKFQFKTTRHGSLSAGQNAEAKKPRAHNVRSYRWDKVWYVFGARIHTHRTQGTAMMVRERDKEYCVIECSSMQTVRMQRTLGLREIK